VASTRPCHYLEPDTLSAPTQFACVEAGQPHIRKLLDDMLDDGGFATTWRASQKDVTW